MFSKHQLVLDGYIFCNYGHRHLVKLFLLSEHDIELDKRSLKLVNCSISWVEFQCALSGIQSFFLSKRRHTFTGARGQGAYRLKEALRGVFWGWDCYCMRGSGPPLHCVSYSLIVNLYGGRRGMMEWDCNWVCWCKHDLPLLLFDSLWVTYRVENLSLSMGRGICSRNRVWNWVAKLYWLAAKLASTKPYAYLVPSPQSGT